jgi:tetratricopeptide (TPR) repeat protein
LIVLARAEGLAPRDPRIPIAIGALLVAAGRHEQAIEPLRRAAELDEANAQIHLSLGEAYRVAGHRHRAAQALDNALERVGELGALREQLLEELEKVDFPIVSATGFGPATDARGDAEPEASLPVFSRRGPALHFWLQLGERFAARAGELELRWVDPGGARHAGGAVRVRRAGLVEASLQQEEQELPAGVWRVECWLDGERVAERHFALR